LRTDSRWGWGRQKQIPEGMTDKKGRAKARATTGWLLWFPTLAAMKLRQGLVIDHAEMPSAN